MINDSIYVEGGSTFTCNPASQLRQDYEKAQALWNKQSALVQRFLEAQARLLSDALIQQNPQVRFNLPDRVVTGTKDGFSIVPANQREQMAGGIIDRLSRSELRIVLKQRLVELESASDEAISVSAALIRYATAIHLVYQMLPAGRSVNYTMASGEEIPSLPVAQPMAHVSAITAPTDAIVEEGQEGNERGELQLPFVPAALLFYLPQWVAFDVDGKLLVNSISEAEAHVASMQRFVSVLHTAVSMASYMVCDEEYQQKRYGMLGQLVNQGRALARYQTNEIILTIKRRAKANDLNRGLSLSLPYFDDQDLELRTYFFEVIPSGRVMFVPAFVVRAAREESAKIAQDTRLSPSTRKHLLDEFHILDQAFKKN